QKGTISLNETVLDWENQEYKTRIGYLPEFPFYYPHLSVMEMMRLTGGLRRVPKELLEERIHYLLERFDLHSYRNLSMDELSQGTKKRVALSSTLLHKPDILILDEPTNGLDPDQVIIVRDTLREYSEQGGLVLLSTHILGLAEKLADHVGIVRSGRLLFAGEPSGDLESLYLAHRLEA
uniref:ABC transporter ATP-binding protein n=1 Tax=Paenibacillus zanthoxyli TaxID=369399 RepID=UPI000471600E